jgi:hypothetical protein
MTGDTEANNLCRAAIRVLLEWLLKQQVKKQCSCHLIPGMEGKREEYKDAVLREWSGRVSINESRMPHLRYLQVVIEATPFDSVFNAGTDESMSYGTRLAIATRANLVPTFGESDALEIVRNFAYRMRSVPYSDFTHLQRLQKFISSYIVH